MEENNCKTIVFSSSASIYGISCKKFLKESSEIKPSNPYGDTKASIELMLKSIFQGSANEWKVANLRYFNPIGAHSSGLIGEDPRGKPNNLFPYLCHVAYGTYKKLYIFGNDWPTNDGTGIRDYIHVMDLAEAHRLTLEYLTGNKPKLVSLNIGTGKGTSVLELIKSFSDINNCLVPYEFTSRRPGDYPVVVADNQLAKSILSWEPKRNLTDMCLEGWRWHKNNPNGYS